MNIILTSKEIINYILPLLLENKIAQKYIDSVNLNHSEKERERFTPSIDTLSRNILNREYDAGHKKKCHDSLAVEFCFGHDRFCRFEPIALQWNGTYDL